MITKTAPTDNQVRISTIKDMELKASQWPDSISLAQGIPSFDTPEPIKQAAHKAIGQGLAAPYTLTYGLPKLRKIIEADLQKQGMGYDWQEEIMITCGAIEAIASSLHALVTPEQNQVIITDPSYTSYQESIKLAGGEVVFTPLDSMHGWQFSLEDISSKITPRTAAILIANPNNPTGTTFSKNQLVQLAELAERHNIPLIIDEVYRQFQFEDKQTFSPAQMPKFRDTVVRIYSFSKVYAMTGWRVGYLHSSATNVEQIVAAHDGLVTCAPAVSQHAACAFPEAREKVQQFCDTLQKRRDLICRRLDRLQPHFAYQKPDSAYFALAKLKNYRDGSGFCQELLREKHVAAVPGDCFGPSTKQFVRFCFGRSEAEINQAFDRIEDFFNYKTHL